MPKRIVEIVLPEGRANDIAELLYEQTLYGYWQNNISDNQARIRILLASGEVETIFDILEPYLEQLPDASAFLFNVEASIPRELNDPKTVQNEEETDKKKTLRISRHELYNDISTNTGITKSYLIMVELSVIVAAIGLVRNDMAIIIGAMVMAPLLIPNVAMALANTLGDSKLAFKSMKAVIAGFVLAFSTSMAIGFFISVDRSDFWY